MSFPLILFYTLAAIILFSALKTVTAKNPVHAALWLVLTFCMSAMTWLLMQAEFLGITLVVVYVGAVMVMFLFVVMMLNIDIEAMRQGFWRPRPRRAAGWRADGGVADYDFCRARHQPCRLWRNERHSRRLQQRARFGHANLYDLLAAV